MPDRPAHSEKPSETEIEITPEMIEAGLEVYFTERDICGSDSLVEQVFRAMAAARRSVSSPVPYERDA